MIRALVCGSQVEQAPFHARPPPCLHPSFAATRPLTPASCVLPYCRRFPVADVRCWMDDMVHIGSWERYNPGVPAPDFQSILAGAAAAGGLGVGAACARSAEEDEKEAAETLQSLSASLVSSRRAAPAVSTGGGGAAAVSTQPAVSSKRQRQQQGALDIMATAAGLGGGADNAADLA